MADSTPKDGARSADELGQLGRQLRVDSIRLAQRAGSGHPTSSMSAADLVAVLISNHLAIDPIHPDRLGNDHLVFSKGHATPLLYAAWAAIGILDDEQLAGYRGLGSVLEGHPTPRVPGVAVATGSLGLGLPFGAGLALAAQRLDRTDARVWVLCGDSEMTEGSVWEAMEYAGHAGLGRLAALVDVNRLGQTGPTRHGWDLDVYRRRFEAAGWHTMEIDGHDVEQIDDALRATRDDARPSAVLARTHKGSGVAETDDVTGKHGKPLDDPDAAVDELGGPRSIRVIPRRPALGATGVRAGDHDPPQLPRWDVGEEVATRDAFGGAVAALAAARPDVIALDAEVGDSTRLDEVEEACPDRYVQLHIAEQLMAAVGTGLQATGWRPVMATFAAFWTRAHDVLRMAAISRADLCLAGSHAGVSIGQDGPSQMGLEDLALMRSLHGSTVLYPCDANQTAALLARLIDVEGIGYLRTTRGGTPVIYEPGEDFAVGGSRTLRAGPEDVATVVAAGVTVHEALDAAAGLADQGVAVRVVDAYSVEPIDADALVRAAIETRHVVVVEDHHAEGGLGEAVLSALAGCPGDIVCRHLAVRTMPGSADPAEQRREAGIDADAIARAVREIVREPAAHRSAR